MRHICRQRIVYRGTEAQGEVKMLSSATDAAHTALKKNSFHPCSNYFSLLFRAFSMTLLTENTLLEIKRILKIRTMFLCTEFRKRYVSSYDR